MRKLIILARTDPSPPAPEIEGPHPHGLRADRGDGNRQVRQLRFEEPLILVNGSH